MIWKYFGVTEYREKKVIQNIRIWGLHIICQQDVVLKK